MNGNINNCEIDLKKSLCLQFCPYYKPSKSDEYACKGFFVVKRLINEGKKINFKKSNKVLENETVTLLRRYLCISCQFYENDCDFVQEKENAPPCGGFYLLGELLESNILIVENIRDLCKILI